MWIRSLPQLDDRWTFHCVRGPLTAETLGLRPETAVTDPAALVRLFVGDEKEKRHEISFMPHVESLLHALTIREKTLWQWGCEAAGVNFIDPRDSVEDTLTAIQQSRLLIAEAMHGAIVADALRVPWIPVRFHEHILEFKWRDWCASLDMEFNPVTLHPPLDLRPPSETPFIERVKPNLWPVAFAFDLPRIAEQTDPCLSELETLEVATVRLQDLLERLPQ